MWFNLSCLADLPVAFVQILVIQIKQKEKVIMMNNKDKIKRVDKLWSSNLLNCYSAQYKCQYKLNLLKYSVFSRTWRQSILNNWVLTVLHNYHFYVIFVLVNDLNLSSLYTATV